MKIIGLIESMILEASKKDVLINKLGFSEDNAELLSSIAGPVSVWLGNKLIDLYAEQWKEIHLRDYPDQSDSIEQDWKNPQYRKRQGVNFLNTRNGVRVNQSAIVSIMDWIRVGLNGNFKEHQDKKLSQLYDLSLEWHDSLGVGDGDINYIEKNDVIRDYRNEDGVGFYWVDLNTNDSGEECSRMGHCGRTNSGNTIYSLRENRRINKDYTINKSHLTAAVGNSDGFIYQLKGPKNSKPDERYNQYVTDLILNDDDIQGFGSEYNSVNDFKITDLPKEEIQKIYTKKPQLFNTYKLKSYLKNQLGIEGVDIPSMEFELDIEPHSIHHYIEGDWVQTRRTRKTPAGNELKDDVWFTEVVLSGDIWELYDGNGDWKSSLQYHVNDENANKIREIIKSRIGDDYDPSYTLENLINEYDDEYDIRSAIDTAYSDTASSEYYDYVIRELKSALEEYGEVLKLNDEGALIKINLTSVIDNIGADETEVDEAFDRCDDDPSCVFGELLGDYYDKPRMRLDDRWYPDIDDEDFNSYLNDRLYDIG
jgi:hypothetical protein